MLSAYIVDDSAKMKYLLICQPFNIESRLVAEPEKIVRADRKSFGDSAEHIY